MHNYALVSGAPGNHCVCRSVWTCACVCVRVCVTLQRAFLGDCNDSYNATTTQHSMPPLNLAHAHMLIVFSVYIAYSHYFA